MMRLALSPGQRLLALLACAALAGAAAACFEQAGSSSQPSPGYAGDKRIGGLTKQQWQSRARFYERRREELEQKLEQAQDARFDSGNTFTRSSRPQKYSRIQDRNDADDAADEAAERKVDGLEARLEKLEDEISDFERKARDLDVPSDWLL
jgi:hypothetical protein